MTSVGHPTLSVALMVRNEAATLARALASVREVADQWVVLDTGSTDATCQVLKDATVGWPGPLHHAGWVDFSTGRNHLAALVRIDWVLYLDADHELVEHQTVREELAAAVDAYRVASVEEPVYLNPRLVRAGAGTWRGRTHEALHLPPGTRVARSGARVARSGARVVHRGDGGFRADKLSRDVRLLRADLAERDEVRTRFYLGSTLLAWVTSSQRVSI
jgi:glycosyltransferase involved in cell wall biosynthesis